MIRRTKPAAVSHGVSLVETLMVLIVLAVLAALAAPSYQSFTDRRRLEGAAHEYVSHLHWARAHAVQTGSTVRIKVESDAQGACYAVRQGSSGGCSCLDAQANCGSDDPPLLAVHFPADARVRITGHGKTERRIDPLRGTLTPTDTVEFSTARGHSVRAVTNLMGRTRLCTPSSGMGGMQPC